jgi:hypothetical protein
MKVVFLKEISMTAAVFLASVFAMQAQAHCFDNRAINAVSTSAFQNDIYHVSCPAGTTGVSGRIALVSGTGVSMEIGKGATHTTASDASASAQNCNAAGDVPSGFASVPALNSGSGVYVIAVTKDTATASTYDFSFHCNGNDVPASPTGVVGADFDNPMNH